jgi:hypothetical protein
MFHQARARLLLTAIALPVLLVVLLAPALGARAALTAVRPQAMNRSGMGPMGRHSMTTWTGYYDGHTVLYLSTDTSSKAEAMRDHINYAPGLAKVLSSTANMYIITNGAYASRGPAFGTEPGESDYTPLWQEVLVTWKNAGKATFLGSDNDVLAAQKAGKVTLKMTGTVLNCPVIKVMKGSGSM